MKKSLILLGIIAAAFLLLTGCGKAEPIQDVATPTAASTPPTVAESIVPASPTATIEPAPTYAEVSHGYGNPVRCELSDSEINTLWEMYQNLEFVSGAERGNEETAFVVDFFGEYDPEDPMRGTDKTTTWIIYEDNVAYFPKFDGTEETYACSPGCIDYDKLTEIYENQRIIKRSEEDIASAFEAARAYCNDCGVVIDRLWYDEVCSSAGVIFTLSRDHYEGGNLNESNYLILYVNCTWPSKKPVEYQQLVLRRDSEGEPWTAGWNGYAPPYVERSDNPIIVG